MGFGSLLLHTVTISNPSPSGSIDRYGNPLDTLTSFSSRARVEQLSGDEDIINRDTRVTQYRVYLPAGTSVSALSTLVWTDRAMNLRASAEPDHVAGGSGTHHVELACEEVNG